MKTFQPLTCLSRAVLFFSAFCFFQHAAAQSKPWVAPATAKALVNPLKGNTAVLKDAKVLYLNTCAPCHGAKGKGDGLAASALNPKPADHTSAVVQGETDGALFWKISEGRNPMPTYKTVLTDNQRWEMVEYIRTLSATAKK
jgi:mono/diheme cytochrome c family protein